MAKAKEEGGASLDRCVHKVTLSTGRVVLVDDLTVGKESLAMRVAASRPDIPKDNAFLLALEAQAELLKMLIIEIDGKKPSKIELERIDKLFSYREYKELESVVVQLRGIEGNPQYQVETEICGDK